MTEQFDAVEKDVGISMYLSDAQGFAAVVKARYSDFLVHEVDKQGQVARLDSLEPPPKDAEETAGKKRKEPPPTEEEEAAVWPTMKAQLAERIGEETADKVISMLRHWETCDDDDDDDSPKYVQLPAIPEKERRKAIHQLVRTFPTYAVADTFEGAIRIWHKQFEKHTASFGKYDRPGKARNDRQKGWPADQKNFLQFVMYKENIDTTTATKDITKRIRGKSRIGYAGMKDKRGVTAQFCTLYRKKPHEIMSFNKRHSGGCGNSAYGPVGVIRVGNFQYVDQELTLGMLNGNRFDVVLRNVCGIDRDGIEKASNAFKQYGFINYFGMQRFGKDQDTHKVGLKVLAGDYQGAVHFIMRPKDGETPRYVIAREKWLKRFENVPEDDEEKRKKAEQTCASAVVRDLGRFMTCEVSILNCLKKNPLDYKKSFSYIPKQTRMMFLHAVQSVIWNRLASQRIEMLGQKVCVGDLVQIGDADSEGGGSGTSGRRGKTVKVVTEEDVTNSTYSLTDVVLPLVGNKVEYPTNETAEMLGTLLKELGLEKESFNNLKDRELMLGGDYRKMICMPKDVDYTVIEYDDPLQPLVQTDLMKINDQALKSSEERKLLGVVFGFILPPSAYATVALRELMKRPTSSQYQRLLQLEGPCEGKLEGAPEAKDES